jgi:dipeptidyl aminopeptidase/acylaminoacyl peptidase
MSGESYSEQLIKIASRVGLLTGILHRPDPATAARPPCVVASHGLYSDRESRKLADLGRSLTGHGVAFLRYDCMGCGDSGGDFARTTPASRVTDLTEVLGWVRRQEDLDTGRIGLMGSSMGGFASLCLAATDPGIVATAVWAAPATFDDLHDEDREREAAPDAEAAELDEEPEEWTPPVLGPEFYRTLHRPDLVGLASSLTNVLFLYGEDDETVPLSHGLRLHRLAGEPKRIEIFPGGDHRFSDPAARARAVALSTRWLVQGLLG